MNVKITAIVLVVTLLFSAFLFQGCLFSCLAGNSTSTEEETRLLVGFSVEKFLDSLVAGVYADTKVFDIDDVTLKFCYGGNATEKDLVEWHYAAYVIKEDYDYSSGKLYEDFSDIPGFYLLAEKTPYEFNHGPFDMTLHYTDDLYFHYREEWTVPREYFTKSRGYFTFWVISLMKVYVEDGGLMYELVGRTNTARRKVYYRVEGNKVKLAESEFELYGDASDWAGNEEIEETGQNESGEN